MADADLRARVSAYYSQLGLEADAWHIGPEHPALEELAIGLAGNRTRVLELGVQSGGFTIPVVLALHRRPGFTYTGIDNLQYTNAVPLRHVEAFLRQSGVAEPLTFIEGDSSATLGSFPADSFDLLLIDHYKPKYPVDLYTILSHDLLSGDGRIILHDVLAHAAPDWEVCKRICARFGYRWTEHPEVPSGAAVVARGGEPRGDPTLAASVYLRWYRHAATTMTRRAAGSTLRGLGLRR